MSDASDDMEFYSSMIPDSYYKEKQMSNEVKGSVWIVKGNPAKNGATMYSVLLSDGNWYGTGADDPKAKDGDGVTFTYTANGKFKNIDMDSFKVYPGKGKKMPEDRKTSKSAGSNKNWKGKSWTGQPAHVQAAIIAQSAQKSAVDLVVACLANNYLAIPKTANKQYDAIVGYVDSLTDHFFKTSASVMVKVESGTKVADLIANTDALETHDFDGETDKIDPPKAEFDDKIDFGDEPDFTDTQDEEDFG